MPSSLLGFKRLISVYKNTATVSWAKLAGCHVHLYYDITAETRMERVKLPAASGDDNDSSNGSTTRRKALAQRYLQEIQSPPPLLPDGTAVPSWLDSFLHTSSLHRRFGHPLLTLLINAQN